MTSCQIQPMELPDPLPKRQSHTLSLNAGQMSSGLYFVQVEVDGRQMATQKLVLTR